MPFCDLCNGLTIEKLYPPNVYYHAENLTALQQSGKTCRLCVFIHWCITRTDNPNCFHLESVEPFPAGQLPRLRMSDDAILNEELDEVLDGWQYRLTKPLNGYSIKLQIVLERAVKSSSCRKDDDGFAYVGIWLNPGRMRTDMGLAVEEGILLYCV
ncbi:hypothetical protein E8E12_003612 [Didymella heteroderae]|uniref:Uncharacterized protein n=1 Tax=Didymella heteroderae TaxID=1769908 RepID=A0A9P5BXE1_9PLEO|nr:hypothetical protein E8E12_003612 [Didymella heteroderae]